MWLDIFCEFWKIPRNFQISLIFQYSIFHISSNTSLSHSSSLLLQKSLRIFVPNLFHVYWKKYPHLSVLMFLDNHAIILLHSITEIIHYLRWVPKLLNSFPKGKYNLSLFDFFFFVFICFIPSCELNGCFGFNKKSISLKYCFGTLYFISINFYSPTLMEKVCILHLLLPARDIWLWMHISVSTFVWAASKTSSYRFLESVPSSAQIKFLC